MHLLLHLAAALALVAADGYYYQVPSTRAPLLWKTLPSPAQYQYHTQDSFGQYTYGYGEPHSTKQEVRTLDGVTRGSYTYLDATGKLQTVAYTADAGGFHVAATNLPKAPVPADGTASLQQLQPVQYTPEVAAARLEHLAAHQQATLGKFGLYQTPATSSPFSIPSPVLKAQSDVTEKHAEHLNILPQPVQDTPEVAAAKAEFFKHYEEVKQRNERLRQKQQPIPGYALVKSQPITVTVPLSNYKPAIIPNGIFPYNVVVPSNAGEYLSIANLNL